MSALRQLAQRLESLHRLRIPVRVKGDPTGIDDFKADHLYRIAQEAINNAIQHGRAAQIAISLDVDSRRILLSVTDDGQHSRAVPHPEGLGLGIMRYRARLIGAALAIATLPAGGTRIRCRLGR